MKKITIFNDKKKALIANIYSENEKNNKLVIIIHGYNEDKTLQGNTPIYAEALLSVGISVLAFDLSGFGESDPEFISRSTAIADLKSVIQFVINELHYHSIGLFGHSLGSAAALECYSKEIAAIATIGGVTGSMPFEIDRIFSSEQLEEFKTKGYATELRTYNTRPEILVDKKMLTEVCEVDQEKLLSRVHCPVLLIHGDSEREEFLLYELSKNGMKYLPKTSEVKLIQGADHNFRGFEKKVSELISEWFSRFL